MNKMNKFNSFEKNCGQHGSAYLVQRKNVICTGCSLLSPFIVVVAFFGIRLMATYDRMNFMHELPKLILIIFAQLYNAFVRKIVHLFRNHSKARNKKKTKGVAIEIESGKRN